MQIFKIKFHFSKASTYSARWTLFPKVTRLIWQAESGMCLWCSRAFGNFHPKSIRGKNTSK